MRISHWLTRFQNRRPNRKTNRRVAQQTTESLEQRAMLTTVGILTGPTDLTIFVDDGDAATVQRNSTTGNVEVLDANGQPYTSIPSIQASLLTSLNIFADDADNTLSVAPVTSSEFSMLNTIVIESGDGDDVITGSDDFGEMIDGGDGNDIITGGGGNDTIDAGDGDDLVTGGAGNDSILGGNGQDTIDGGTGNDNIDAGDGQDSVDGGDGDDVINAGDGLDTVNGGAGADNINGMSGTDLLNGDADNDTILGGSENDTVNGGDGNDIVNGQAGNDTVSGDAGDDTGYGGGGRDVLFGGDGDDIINGQSGNDTLNGEAGSDRGYGGSGNDSLDGGAGNDTLRGHSGNDTLIGGGDADNLDGGSGDDLVSSRDTDPAAPVVVLPQLSINDVVVSSEGDDNTAILLSNQAAYATASVNSTTNSRLINAADLNDDGFVDIITAHSTGTVGVAIASVLLNNGDGTFAAPIALNAPDTPTDIEVGDFNNDGIMDFAIAGGLGVVTPRIIVQLSNGDGTFTEITGPSNGSGGGGLASADINGDGFLDLVTGIQIGGVGAGLYVYANNGDGTFAAPVRTPVLNPTRIEAIDADSTGSTDFVVLSQGGLNSFVAIASSDSAGAISVGATVPVPNLSTDLEVADLNADGIDDVVVVSGRDQTISTLFGNGDGTLANGATIATAPNANTVSLADFNGDGFNDMLIGVNGDSPFILFNDGTGNFSSTQMFATNSPTSTSDGLIAAELNNSGLPEFAFLTISPDSVNVFLNVTPPQSEATFTVSLSQASSSTVTVNYTTVDSSAVAGADYDFAANTLMFAPGVTSQTITVPIIGDNTLEANENFFVNLGSPVNATIGDAQGHGTIVDDDGGMAGPTIQISDATLTEGDTGSAAVSFTISMTAAPAGTVTVQYETQDGTATAGNDYTGISSPQTVTFTPSNTSQTVTVNVTGDLLNEGDETFFVNLLNPVGALLSDSQGIATITDNDASAPPVVPDDTLLGGSGNDTLIGDLGNDRMDGGSGNDSLSGAGGNDSIQGGDGNDTIDGGSGDDTIAGQNGDDVITAGAGIDEVIWDGLGNGDDTLLASDGAETLTVQGDSGVNNFTVDSNGGLLRVTEGAASITVATSTTTVNVNGGSEADVITIGELIDVNPLVLNIDGQADNDTITAADANIGDVRMFLNGGTGNDTITGSRDGDSINGDGGDDSVLGGLGNDTVDGGEGNDTLNGEVGNDSLLGNTGNDLMDGGDGDDILSGSLGNDTAIGGLGNDSLFGGFGSDVLNGNSGNDLADGGRDADRVLGGSGDDSLKGGTGDDTIRGQSGSDLIKGGDGDDNILGDSGNDVIDAGDGDDNVDGGNGNDIATGGDGNDTLNGMSGADTLLGGNGADNQIGGAGVDSLYGEEGDDSLNGGSSTDQFNGGEGADVLVSPDAGEVDNNNLAISASVFEALALLNGF